MKKRRKWLFEQTKTMFAEKWGKFKQIVHLAEDTPSVQKYIYCDRQNRLQQIEAEEASNKSGYPAMYNKLTN